MQKKTLLSALAGLLMMATPALATTVTFDDLNVPEHEPGEKLIPAGMTYSGLQWENFGALNPQIAYQSWQSDYDRLQDYPEDWIAFNLNGYPAAISSDQEWTWDGMWATAAWTGGVDLLQITGTLNGNEVFNRLVPLQDYSSTWISGEEQVTVDTLSFVMCRMDGYGNFVPESQAWFGMDDFEYHRVAPVPEPATLLLFGSGLAALAGTGMKKKKKENVE